MGKKSLNAYSFPSAALKDPSCTGAWVPTTFDDPYLVARSAPLDDSSSTCVLIQSYVILRPSCKQSSKTIYNVKSRKMHNWKMSIFASINMNCAIHNITLLTGCVRLPCFQNQSEALGFWHAEASFSNLLHSPWIQLINWIMLCQCKE